jgi:hypothetical protein
MNTSESQSTTPVGFHPYRGRGRGRGRDNQGCRFNTPQTRGNTYDHGDMKTGLFKPSFLEDPWKRLTEKRQLQNSMQNERLEAVNSMEDQLEVGGQIVNEEEIILPDDDED